MLKVTRCNIKDKSILTEDRMYIGRANKSYELAKSPLSNPYVLGKDGDRDEVIQKYRLWLWKQVYEKRSDAWKELCWLLSYIKRRGEDPDLPIFSLACWCKSNEKCHGDVIISCLNWMEINHIGE